MVPEDSYVPVFHSRVGRYCSTHVVYILQTNKQNQEEQSLKVSEPKEMINLYGERKVNYAGWNTAHGIHERHDHTALHKYMQVFSTNKSPIKKDFKEHSFICKDPQYVRDGLWSCVFLPTQSREQSCEVVYSLTELAHRERNNTRW